MPHVLEVVESSVVSAHDSVVVQFVPRIADASSISGTPWLRPTAAGVVGHFEPYGWAATDALCHGDPGRGLDPKNFSPRELGTQDQVENLMFGAAERAGRLRRHNPEYGGRSGRGVPVSA